MTNLPEDDGPTAADQRIGSLRGAEVATVNVRRLGDVLVVLCLVVLLVLTVAFFIAAAHKNDQIDQLKQHGQPVTITVTGCLGLLGGSGSNGAGYTCRGRFVLDGHRYEEAIPGNIQYATGTHLHGVVVPGDPGLVTTSRILATEHTSASVYVLPIVLLAVLLVAVAILLALWRRARRRRPAS